MAEKNELTSVLCELCGEGMQILCVSGKPILSPPHVCMDLGHDCGQGSPFRPRIIFWMSEENRKRRQDWIDRREKIID